MLRRNYAKVYGLSKSRLGVLAVLRRRPTRHECRLGSFQLTPRLHAAYSRLHPFPLGPFPLAPIRPSYIQACSPSCAARRFSRCPASWRAVGRSPRAATSASGPGPPPPHLRRDWAHPDHICAGTGLTPATSAPGLGSPRPHLRRDSAAAAAVCGLQSCLVSFPTFTRLTLGRLASAMEVRAAAPRCTRTAASVPGRCSTCAPMTNRTAT